MVCVGVAVGERVRQLDEEREEKAASDAFGPSWFEREAIHDSLVKSELEKVYWCQILKDCWHPQCWEATISCRRTGM